MFRCILICTVCCLYALTASPLHASTARSRAVVSAPIPYDGSSDQTNHPYRTRWGRYTVRIDEVGEYYRLRVVDTAGRVQREVRAEDILGVEYPVLKPGHLPALQVWVAAGGVAESSERTYLFSGEHGVRNILIFTGEISQIRHPRGGGKADLIADSSVPMQYFTGFDHYGCGTVMLALRWNGSRYVLADRHFPWLARCQARTDRQDLVDAAKSERRDPTQVGMALGACANLWTIGQGASYYPWLRKQMTRAGWQWFLSAQPELRTRMDALGQMVSVSQQTVFVIADN